MPGNAAATGDIFLTIRFHKGEPSRSFTLHGDVAIDTETQGLNPLRDRLCVVQLSPGDGTADVVQIERGQKRRRTSPNFCATAQRRRYSISTFRHRGPAALCSVQRQPRSIAQKIASRLTRTYTDRHGLKEIVREFLGIDISKQQQSSDWALTN
ncbi:MAG: hypothetical protein H6888_14325 [Nitratireductor sp.]|nr:hypothetical protein [Nitratireductor sp.]